MSDPVSKTIFAIIDHCLRRRALAGTPGTVTHIIGTALPVHRRSYCVYFDHIGRMRPISGIIPVKDLEDIQNG